MARKVDQAVYARIRQLRTQYGLTYPVIAERLGLNERTVRIYLRKAKLGLEYDESCMTPKSSTSDSPN